MAERIHAVEKESGEWVTVEQRNSDYPRRCSSSLDDGQHDEQRAILPSGHSQKPMGNSIIQQTTLRVIRVWVHRHTKSHLGKSPSIFPNTLRDLPRWMSF